MMYRTLIFAAAGIVFVGFAGIRIIPERTANASDLPFRMILPGVASDAEAAPNASLVAAHIAATNDGGLVVTGDVTNYSATPVTNVHVTVSATISGTTATRDTTVLVETLAPGARGPFRAVFALPGDLNAPVAVTLASFEAGASPPSASFSFAGPYPFQIGPPDAKTGVIPYSTVLDQLQAQLTNTTGSVIGEIDIVVAIYDGPGNVVWLGSGAELHVPFEQSGQPQVLAPGQSGSFFVGIPKGLLNGITGHATIVGFVNATIQ
ncbi:MAG: hypothetical protein ABI577_11965 [bacterium]